MHEYYSEAVVLDARPAGEFDVVFSLFTKRYGRIIARAKSARKIISKLTPHLQPGNLVAVRVVEKNGLRIADALQKAKLLHTVSHLTTLNTLLHDGEADSALWQALTAQSSVWSWSHILALLGWSPEHAVCRICRHKPEVFFIRGQEFYCRACLSAEVLTKAGASKLPQSEVLSIA